MEVLSRERVRFSSGGDGEAAHRYPRVFEATDMGLPRLVFAPPPGGEIAALLGLAAHWPGRYKLTYVLVEPLAGQYEAGRYDYHTTFDFDALGGFLRRHGDFIVADGRHHLWIASTDGQSFLIHDRHGLVVAFGDTNQLRKGLEDKGYRPGFLDVPVPHRHHVDPQNDEGLVDLMQGWEWLRGPLNSHDLD
jgi:hypothetical protein